MGTIVAVETDGGVAIAGDRQTTSGGTVTGASANRVLDLEEIGAGAVGREGDVDEFQRRLRADLREAEFERDREVTVEVLGRVASRVAGDTGVEAAVATHDDEGVPRLRQVGPDGSDLPEEVVALGSGAEIALGRLEGTDRDRDLEATEEFVREVLAAVAERDSETGEEVDVWSLSGE